MNETPKIVLCENPLFNEEHDTLQLNLLYDGSMKVYAAVTHFDLDDEEGQYDLKKSVEAYGSTETENEYVIITPCWIIPDEKYMESDDKAKADRLARVFRKLASWYHDYMVWEDAQL